MGPVRKVLLPAILGVAAYYAVFGGEYSVLDVRRIRSERAGEEAELARLQQITDSLRAWADSLEADPATLERLARERFGMIRDGEVLYRFAEPPDSSDGGGDSR